MLEEYIEVVMPIIFNLHQLASFYMPNSVYYPPLAGLTSTQFFSRVYYRLAYAAFEFVSLVVVINVSKRTLRFSSLHQLGFVLEKHAGTIQLKLISMFVYIMQLSLKHVGADFSFKFSWLHPAKTG
ncbi:hypothetical protein PHYSODRAFT_296648 [Phytophthora sojae]|uniref:Uncharacterized protein n=1 Tax=Phytophthora sojae (strain P6497) TaxID=1094619 RepID=G4Z074_PHYSP|nr:hypothetical protein PHYSODRAFT_296648 [Phytophthora sojae]EGZ24631.1 hypothetical protein PHYSODRAFT_296648 [Phytophthora sojae]|eukprot:XP_009519919.1 hypothetical protein PHYSODRAFT_296648 [Phytophthora sojae]